MIPIHLVRLKAIPIFQQLQIEEALLRTDNRNWCIINEGSPPTIVMGISGKPQLLINKNLILQKPIPIVRRFSGGGTVVVDHSTYFVTWIFNSADINVPSSCDKILNWTKQFYRQVIPHTDFQLRENDYVMGTKKFGGNAQYLRKDRWLHHSSLLWDYDPQLMDYLLIPPTMPKYRENRTHIDFLCTLKEHFSSQKQLEQTILQTIHSKFLTTETDLNTLNNILGNFHRKSTQLVELEKKKDC